MAIGTLLASELARSLTPLTTKFFGIPLICTFYIDFVIKTSHLLLIFSVDCMQSSVCTLFSRCEFSLIALSLYVVASLVGALVHTDVLIAGVLCHSHSKQCSILFNAPIAKTEPFSFSFSFEYFCVRCFFIAATLFMR